MSREQLHEKLRLIVEDMRLEVAAVRAERDRPKGGQTCGPRGGPLANAGPGVLQGVEWWARAIDEALSLGAAIPEAAAVKGSQKDARNIVAAVLEVAARLDRAADAKAAALVAGGSTGSVASVVYELRAFAAELRQAAGMDSAAGEVER